MAGEAGGGGHHEDTGVCSVALQTVRGGAVMVDGVETVTGRRVEDAVTVQGRMPQAGPRPHREKE